MDQMDSDWLSSMVHPGNAGPDNNLVRWPNQYGHANRSHRALIDARLNPGSRHVLEGWLFNFYKGLAEPGEAFEEFRRLAGSRYDLLAYMFFLRDMEKYMPIATRTFDEAFRRLGIDVVTTQRCSWEQEEKCALTGIPFQLPGDNSDLQLAPSLDRIDSNGHYEKGNLQIVCRFINFWKGSDDNEEFRRLLAIVRGDDF